MTVGSTALSAKGSNRYIRMARGKRGTGQPFLRGRIWWIKFYVNGKPRFESSHSAKKADAVRLLNQRRADSDQGKLPLADSTTEDLLQLYLTDMKKNGRSSLSDAENNVQEHLRPAFSRRKADDITSGLIDQFITTKQAAGYANSSINRYLCSLRRAFKLGQEATPPLVSRVPKIRMLKEDNVREGFLDHAHYGKLRDSS